MVNEMIDIECCKGSVGKLLDDQWVRLTSSGGW
jgi:hypothetical protein